MIDEKTKEARKMFMAIAVVEHHDIPEPQLSTFEICDRLYPIWEEINKEIHANSFTFEADCILKINKKVANALNAEHGTFLKKQDWTEFVEACGSVEDDPGHVLNWMFSALYWTHLTRFKLVTVWLFINAIRLQYDLPVYYLTLNKLGPFMDSLSGSGPPLYDGQTFYCEDYAN